MAATAVKHSHLGRGGALMKITLQSLTVGGNQVATLRPQEQLELAELEWISSIVMHKDKDSFLVEIDGECESLPLSIVDIPEFVDVGMPIQLGKFEEEFITSKLPNSYIFTIGQIDPTAPKARAKGNANIKATLTCGAVVKVPAFISEGDKIEVNLKECSYKRKA